MMVKISNKFRTLIQVIYHYSRNIKLYWLTNRDKHGRSKKVFFDLTDRRVEPYYYLLIRSFYEASYEIHLKHSFLFIGALTNQGHSLFALDRLFLKVKFGKVNNGQHLIIFDGDRNYSRYGYEKVAHVNFDVYSPRINGTNHLTLPFGMNPKQYITNQHMMVQELRNEQRNMKAFFSGNQFEKAYDHPVINVFFKKRNRIQIINHLVQSLKNQEILSIEKPEDWEVIESEFQNKMVINHWEWSPNHEKNLKSRVKDEDWLITLAKSYFFLATPGIRMPHCFNVVEAMSVGCIPIIEYPEFFNPPLEHMVNCLVFNGDNDLVNKLRVALSLEVNDISKLKVGVEQYYDKHLSIEQIPKKIRNTKGNEIELYMHATEISVQAYYSNPANVNSIDF